MGIRTGAQLLESLCDGREVWIEGARVDDVIQDPRLTGGARTLAELFDLQHDPDIEDQMTYVSPTTGDRVGLSHIQPSTREDLTRRRAMVKHWSDHTLGMFGRSPDFVNVMISSFAAAADAIGTDGAGNLRAYHEHIRENDLALSHTLTNPQVDRSRPVADQEKDLAAKIVRETDAGVVITGARMLATLSVFADEVLVVPAPSYPLPETEEGRAYAFGLAVPVATKGLKLICRPTVVPQAAGSPMDYPLSMRFDEMDAMVIFDEVLVPWERVFIHRDIEACNALYSRTSAGIHMAHQFSTKNLAKAEFMMGLAFALVRTTNIDTHQHIQGLLAELINTTEVVKSCLIASEVGATDSPHGIVDPDPGPLQAVRFLFPQMFQRASEIIRIMGAGGLFMVPSFADLEGEIAADVEKYYQAANADSRSRIKLFRLAYDAVLSNFAGRQQLYERYFAGDPVRAAGFLYRSYEKDAHIERIWSLLDDLERRWKDGSSG